MPSGTSDDKPQQQQSKSSAFPSSSSLYPNQNIWGGHGNTYANGHARGPSLSSKDTIDNGAPLPGGGAHTTATEASSGWHPWAEPARPTSTSPNRTRDNALPKTTNAFGTTSDANVMKNGFGGVNGVNGNSLYSSAFPAQKRASNEASYFDSVANPFPQSRDASAPPSRHSQGSPAYPDIPNGRAHSHAHSSSIHSQRQVAGNAASSLQPYPHQRALNLNKQVEDELSLGLAHRLTLDSAIGKNAVFDQASQSFQYNPGTQSFGDANALKYLNGTEAQHDPLATPLSALKRGSIDRMSPGPSYRLETGNSPRNYHPSPDPWGARVSSRDPRSIDIERRAAPQGMPAPAFTTPFYQYPYGNLQMPPFAANYADPLRHPMLPNYSMPHMSGGYYQGSMASLQPAAPHDAMRGIRSAVLEDFRSNSKTSKRFELKDIYNYIVEFSGDQHGSRFIQSKLETANSDEKDQVFREVEPNAVQLMKDVFGNYVVQKFFEHGNQVQKKILGERMRGKMVELSMQVYACRVVQKALDHVLVDQQADLAMELAPDIMKVIMDQNGNHVVQRIVEVVPRQHLDFIMDAFRGQITSLSMHQYGCRVVQRMMEYGNDADKAIIIKELHPSARLLLTDQYGNYVTQHVIQHGKKEDHDRMVKLVMDQLIDLSKHKFASNVVEVCIEAVSPEIRTEIRERFVKPGSDGAKPLQQLMRDNYANYVIQKLLATLKGDELDSFVEEVKPLLYLQKKNGTSKQIVALEKMLEEIATGTLGDAQGATEKVPLSPSGSVQSGASATSANSSRQSAGKAKRMSGGSSRS